MTITVNGVTISQEAVRVEALHHAAAEDPEAGLVWSGGYGAQRKVAGTEQVLRSLSETLGMGLMGAGGPHCGDRRAHMFALIVAQSAWRARLQRR